MPYYQRNLIPYAEKTEENVYWFSLIIENYSPKWKWLVGEIYLATSRLDKYPPLAIDTEANNCFWYAKILR